MYVKPDDFEHEALLTEVDAADFFRLSVRTLQAWRSRGSGPAFVRVGRTIRYRRKDLIAWIGANIVEPAAEPLPGAADDQ